MLTSEFFPFERQFNPWRELEKLQDDFERLSRVFSETPQADLPAINVWTSPEGAIVSALVPGVRQESLEISVLGETLTLRGEMAPETLQEGASLHRRERPAASFSRTVTLPFRVEGDKVTAAQKDGILAVSLPRRSEDKPKRIHIKAQ